MKIKAKTWLESAGHVTLKLSPDEAKALYFSIAPSNVANFADSEEDKLYGLALGIEDTLGDLLSDEGII